MSHSKQRVKKALESTESLLASLVDRSSFGPAAGAEGETDGGTSLPLTPPAINVEQSLIGLGEEVVTAQVSARQEVPCPSNLMIAAADPLSSLTAMGEKTKITWDARFYVLAHCLCVYL